jgi:hypothetical protein
MNSDFALNQPKNSYTSKYASVIGLYNGNRLFFMRCTLRPNKELTIYKNNWCGLVSL